MFLQLWCWARCQQLIIISASHDTKPDTRPWTHYDLLEQQKKLTWNLNFECEEPAQARATVDNGQRLPTGRHRHRWENFKMNLQEMGRAWTGLIWLRIGTSWGLSWMQHWTFRFCKMHRISWVAEELLASPEGFCSMEFLFMKYPFFLCIKTNCLTTNWNFL